MAYQVLRRPCSNGARVARSVASESTATTSAVRTCTGPVSQVRGVPDPAPVAFSSGRRARSARGCGQGHAACLELGAPAVLGGEHPGAVVEDRHGVFPVGGDGTVDG